MKTRVLVLFLLFFLGFKAWSDNLRVPGIDFYHYWGVAKAQQLSPVRLASPYVQADAYAAVLNQHAASVNAPRLEAANAYRQSLDLTGTPLLYTFFATLPRNYGLALASYQGLQVVMFIAGIVLIGALKGQMRGFLSLALALVATYAPFSVELGVGNLNALQLLLVVLATLLVEKAAMGAPRERVKTAALGTCLFIFIVLLKPNLLLAILFLCVSFGLRYGIPKVVAPVAVAFIGFILATTSGFLGSSRVWLDWYGLLSSSKDRLTYPIEAGNFSVTFLLSTLSGLDIAASVLVVVVLLSGSFCCAMIGFALGKRCTISRGIAAMVEVGRSPGLMVNLALTATLMVSPLVWSHYYILLLFPILWLLDFGRWGVKNVVGLLSLGFASGILLKLAAIGWVPGPEIQALSFCMGCLLAWVGLLWVVVETAKTGLEKSLANVPT